MKEQVQISHIYSSKGLMETINPESLYFHGSFLPEKYQLTRNLYSKKEKQHVHVLPSFKQNNNKRLN